MPPSIEEVARRIEERGTNTPEEVARRISRAQAEIMGAQHYDYIVINEDLNNCVEQIEEIVRKITCF